ncbi:MAG: PH domain-containing protein [Rhodobacteraceae bacterium]|jgi:Bacterial PH domain|nr:PH domain-containing protein [Paracoccaceae bacterium]
MSGHDDFAFDVAPGLPAPLPAGEQMLWQGRPATLALARQAYKLGWIAAYCLGLVLWRAATGYGVAGPAGALAYGLPYVGLGIVACGLVFGLAYAQARSTVYSLTSARVLLRIGAALPVTFNIPYTQIATARLAAHGTTGTIALETKGKTRISALVLWPHLRPWHLARTQPALRCIPDAAAVARLLAEAAETRLAQPIITRDPAFVPGLVAAE